MTLSPRAAAAASSASGNASVRPHAPTAAALAEAELVTCGADSLAMQPTAVVGKRSCTSSAQLAEPRGGSGAIRASEVVTRFASSESHCSRDASSLSRSTPKRSRICCPEARRSLAHRSRRPESFITTSMTPRPGNVTSETQGTARHRATSKPWGVMGSYTVNCTFSARQRSRTCSPVAAVLAADQTANLSSGATQSLKSPKASRSRSAGSPGM
mmetsp:Transcript_67996/g.199007  ORF Transcript_67996/g.199007 Transcript_67996/m.199007 type:complete len:214 (+) Transcript_67996:1031-1672(+)